MIWPGLYLLLNGTDWRPPPHSDVPPHRLYWFCPGAANTAVAGNAPARATAATLFMILRMIISYSSWAHLWRSLRALTPQDALSVQGMMGFSISHFRSQ